MITAPLLLVLQLASPAVTAVPVPTTAPAMSAATTTTATAVTDAPPPVGLGACSDPWLLRAGLTGAARRAHPDILRERFAAAIAQRAWPTVVSGYAAQIDSALRETQSSGATFAVLRDSLRTVMDRITDAIVPALALPMARWADTLAKLEVNRFKPFNSDRNVLVFLQSSTQGLGLPIDTTKMSADERKVICWSAWSLYRLFQNVNFETIPDALVRVEAQTRRWERYRSDGPMQLPHELAVNRLKRAIFPNRGSDRFNPPRWDLVAAHPFGAVELTRVEGRFRRTESLALEVAGATVWINDWRQHIGASFAMAYDADGRVGGGLVARAGGYATAGVLRRKDAAGVNRTSVLFMIDAMRLLKSDVVPLGLRQAQGVAGEILNKVK